MRLAPILAAVVALTMACATDTAPTGATTDADLEAGRTLYLQNCAACHGVDLRGTDAGPSFLSIVYEPGHHPDIAFQVAVTRGVQQHHWDFGPMLPVPGLSATDVEAIVAHVRHVQQQEGFEP
ncbi:MAG TPA: cytochrome c [Acidimicrobiia bacterium]|nr:cytochrome c [Acidimicrobiia bacterium]